MLNLLDRTTNYTNEVSTESIFSYLTSQKVKTSKVIPMSGHKKASTCKNTYKLADKCEDGVMFHAWNWYFNDVKNNIKEIAEAGFTTVQVSPVQPTKDNNLSFVGDWWKFYQPTDFSIGNVLGSTSDFKEMCDEAKKYGVKIVVDVVTNHLANNSGKGNHAKWDRSDSIPSYLKDNDSFWHEEWKGAFNNNDKDRTSMTQGAIGMPGLNTGNKELQKIIINFLNKAQELGADGFRFDAAKHIELPTDEVSSDFWPSVTAGIKSKKSDAFVYGEILNDCATDIKNYTKYMKVTDNEYGWSVLDSVLNGNATLAQNYIKHDCAKNFITWVESHDTYAGDYGRKSNIISDTDIVLGWCIVASRADSIPLFYGRPSEGLSDKIGGPGNLTWKDNRVSAINKFHNNFSGQSEYIRILNYDNVFEIERGNSGVTLVNVGNYNEKICTETTLNDGEYQDRISGQKVVVKDGYLTAELAPKSVIVAYTEAIETQAITPAEVINFKRNIANLVIDPNDFPLEASNKVGHLYVTKPHNWGNKVYAYVYSEDQSGTKHISNWPGIEMQITEDRYTYELPKDWRNNNTQVIFNDGYNQMPMYFNPGEYYQTGTSMIFDGETIIHEEPIRINKQSIQKKYLDLLSENLSNAISS